MYPFDLRGKKVLWWSVYMTRLCGHSAKVVNVFAHYQSPSR